MADDRDDALSLAFMRSHPAPAARVLESLPAAEAYYSDNGTYVGMTPTALVRLLRGRGLARLRRAR